VIGEPCQPVHRQVLAAPLETADVANADAESFREGLSRPATSLAQLHESEANIREQAIGIFAWHTAKDAR
jgi:hypothetical protein